MEPILNFRAITGAVIRQEGEEGRRLTFIASDGTRDSAGTVLNPKGWDLRRFNKNGIIGYQHKVYGSWEGTDNPDNVIGKGQAYIKEDRLMVDVEFEPAEINPLAEKIYQKLLFGSLNAVSVGFVPVGKGAWGEGQEALTGENPTYYYAGQELLEVSVVNIPANPNATKKSYIQESIDAEMERLRSEVKAEPAPDPQPAPEPEPAPAADPAPSEEEKKAIEAARIRLDMSITVARAALHNSLTS
jgi:HK97 family phage prohead protease